MPITIRVGLSDLPAAIRRHDTLGMALAGIDQTGDLHEDPDDGLTPCLVIDLTIDRTLEPVWTVYRPNKDAPPVTVTATARQLIGAFKVDERINTHLRWSRTSALGRLTDVAHRADELLLNANREARKAVSEAIPAELSELVGTVQQRLHALGSGEFKDLQPGLDLSLSTASGNLALYEGAVPLSNYGLGTRRLAGVAAQQLANEGRGIILVDEVEYGLEPHRLVSLLANIKKSASLALVTTHSPTALRHLNVDDLGIVRMDSAGTVTVSSFPPEHTELQRLIRSSPEAFLARRVVLTEGKTEFGFLLELLHQWDEQATTAGQPSSAAIGVVAVEGSGGATIDWARVLTEVGYDVVVFIDSDVPKDRVAADELRARGVAVIRWKDDYHIEGAVTDTLTASELTTLTARAVELADDPSASPNNYLTQLRTRGLPATITTLDVETWIADGISLDAARQTIAAAAHKFGWYKRVDKGRAMATLLQGAQRYPDSETASKIGALRAAIFAPTRTTGDNEPEPEPAAEPAAQ